MSRLQDAPSLAWDGGGLPPEGRIVGVPEYIYHGEPGISRSGLKHLGRSPAHYLSTKFEEDKRTEAKDVGDAFHVLALQPHLWDSRIAVKPTKGAAWDLYRDGVLTVDGKAKPPGEPLSEEDADTTLARRSGFEIAVWDRFESENESRAWITKAQEAHVRRMVEAIRAHPIAGPLCHPPDLACEVSYYWNDPEAQVLCKARTDGENYAHNVVVDLKSALDASYSGFAKAVASYEYHCQDAHYMRGITLCGGWMPQAFVFVVVEKEPIWVKGRDDSEPRQTHAIGVYTLFPELRKLGATINRRRLALYADCKRADVWEAYDPDVRDLDVPGWAYRDNAS